MNQICLISLNIYSTRKTQIRKCVCGHKHIRQAFNFTPVWHRRYRFTHACQQRAIDGLIWKTYFQLKSKNYPCTRKGVGIVKEEIYKKKVVKRGERMLWSWISDKRRRIYYLVRWSSGRRSKGVLGRVE